jgi:hypothetical protein
MSVKLLVITTVIGPSGVTASNVSVVQNEIEFAGTYEANIAYDSIKKIKLTNSNYTTIDVIKLY